MNQPITRLFVVVMLLFGGLAGATSWWTVVKADELTGQELNKRALLRGLKVRRGVIRAADGTLLARSVRDEEGNFSRRYPEGGLFAHAIGYSFTGPGQTGLERERNAALSGTDEDGITNLVDELTGARPEGENITTTLDPAAQRVAIRALNGQKGSVVALDPRTGAVKAMVSTPGYDPNEVRSTERFNAFNTDPASPLLNLATQAGDPPGSTFKVVTAVAAIDSGKYEPESRVNGANGKEISGVPLNNFGQAQFGDITLTEALTRSVNTVWASVGEDLGKETMAEYMERFGFGKDPELDYPDGQMLPSGVYRNGRRIEPTSRFVDVGRMAIGQSLLRVSPLQMALVAAAVANGGELMKPHIVDVVRDGDGRITDEVEPEVQARVMSEETAAKVTEMMASVVREGSGTAAALAGIEVAGKTGTAEKNIEQRINQPWFIGFAPRAKPEFVVAATVQRSVGGTGGEIAAPIAKAVLQELLSPVSRLEPGTIVDGRYDVKSRVGAGGMAEVYCAEDLQLGRKVALKVLYARFAEDEEFLERFRREASSAAGLQHQNVVSVYDRGEFDDTAYIAMEYVDGRTLKAIVSQEGPLAPARAIELTTQILRAARFAHKRGVIHRDFKPHNVIVDANDAAKVTDFGIARAGASDMTQTGSIMGTAQYLSPEQAQGLPVSAQSDLYSIGILLFELLTGRVPFEGDSAVAIALKQVSETPPPPSVLNSAVTPELERVVLKALEKEPARRFADADEFAAALAAAGRGLGVSAAATGATAVAASVPPVVPLPPYDPSQTSTFPVSESYARPAEPLLLEEERERRRWWIPLLAGLLVAAAVVGALLLFQGNTVVVPDVTGVQQAEAEVTLRNQGFTTDTVPKAAPEEAGTVIGQDPRARAEVDEGATVTLTISSGPGLETVPDNLVGMGRRASRRALTQLGFRVEEVERASSEVGRDRVISVSPDGGQRLERGMLVTLTVSTGPESAAVPDVLRQSRDAASAALRDAGFEVDVEDEERRDVDAGTVVAQDPAGGQRRPQGSTITITVATEPDTVTVPDVTGDSEAEATGKLTGAGFDVERQTRESENPDDDGRVLAQSPGGGEAERGATVTITVGTFDDSQILPGGDAEGPTGPTGP